MVDPSPSISVTRTWSGRLTRAHAMYSTSSFMLRPAPCLLRGRLAPGRLPLVQHPGLAQQPPNGVGRLRSLVQPVERLLFVDDHLDRKSTRLNSSHVKISYAVFCLKKKN